MSIFKVFNSILSDPASEKKEHKETVGFVRWVVREFFTLALQVPSAFTMSVFTIDDFSRAHPLCTQRSLARLLHTQMLTGNCLSTLQMKTQAPCLFAETIAWTKHHNDASLIMVPVFVCLFCISVTSPCTTVPDYRVAMVLLTYYFEASAGSKQVLTCLSLTRGLRSARTSPRSARTKARRAATKTTTSTSLHNRSSAR
jgi:hypothetical protein